MPVSPRGSESFEEWFAHYLEGDQVQVAHLLRDRTATRFLIAWSLLESHCFGGFAQEKKLHGFSEKLSSSPAFRRDELGDFGLYFHDRYQDKKLYENLIHQKNSSRMAEILAKSFDEVTDAELVFLLVYVVFRYRNNIFHGNKGVTSWLRYAEQIRRSTTIMQVFISVTTELNH